MPLNLIPPAVVPGTVLPQSLSTSFVMTATYPLLTVMYNDGTYERSLIQDFSNAPRMLRTWGMAKRLCSPQLDDLFTFWTTKSLGGLNPFYFYDPYGVLPGDRIGSNYDATGDNTQGRVTVFFRGNWAQRTEMGRHTIPNLMLIETWSLVEM